jgi:hypothetical protein
VLGVLLVAAVAGAITHIPAGLGVLEAVFLALLSDAVPAHVLLGACWPTGRSITWCPSSWRPPCTG